VLEGGVGSWRRGEGMVHTVEERSPPTTVSRVWVAAVSAARRVSLRRALLEARVSNDYPSGS